MLLTLYKCSNSNTLHVKTIFEKLYFWVIFENLQLRMNMKYLIISPAHRTYIKKLIKLTSTWS